MRQRTGRFQNRVLPNGDIVRNTSDCLLMGNRGGRFHTEEQTLTTRRWASRHWIICVTEFNDRHREIMTPNSYTELFFLDEATALAAGHRPCFECRRQAFYSFMIAWNEAKGLNGRGYVHEVDRELHRQRWASTPVLATSPIRVWSKDLPVGAMFLRDGGWSEKQFWLRNQDGICRWTEQGYVDHQSVRSEQVTLITASTIVDTIREGFRPILHGSANTPASD